MFSNYCSTEACSDRYMLHTLRSGLDFSKHLRVVFVGEPAVDDGGPLREFLYILMKALASSNTIFCGPDETRMPQHNVTELSKKTFYYAGVIMALSLLHGGPAPQFFTSAVANYIVHGAMDVNAGVADVVNNNEIMEKISKVINKQKYCIIIYASYNYRLRIPDLFLT